MRWLSLLLAGCVGSNPPSLVVHVTTEAGEPIADATVAVVCERNANGGAARTNGDGLANVTVFSSETTGCVVTISSPGFDPQQVREVAACASESACEPIEIALVQVIP